MNFQIFILFILNTFSAVGYSLIAPLFPTLKKHNIGEDLIGFIISMFPLTNFGITPFCPYLIYRFGRIKIFYIAAILEGGCTIFYGFLKFINNFYLFIFLSILTRLLHGAGAGITATLVYSLGSTLSDPEEIAKSLGYIEMAWSLGVASGPFFGSFLYHFGGYSLPFWILGLLFFISIYMIKYLKINEHDNSNDESPSFFNYIKFFSVLISMITTFFYYFGQVYFFPSLTNHLTKKWGLSVEFSSIMFIIPMFFYLIGLFFVNKILNQFGLYINLLIGHILLTIGPIFIYPLKFLPQNIGSIIFGLILIGVSGVFINVQILMEISLILKFITPGFNQAVYNDIASAIYNVAINIGDFSGPIIGGFISNKYGFKYSNIFTFFMGIIITLIFCFYFKKEIINEYYDKTKYIKLNEENLINKIDNDINYKENEQYNNSTNNNDSKIIMDIIDDKYQY